MNEILAADQGRPISKNARCARLASRLGLHPKTVMQISNGGYCGKSTARKIAHLHAGISPTPRAKRLTLTIDYTDDEQRRRHQALSMEERRAALDAWLER